MSSWRNTTEYRHWKAQVLWRDRACVICNSKKRPHAHHVNHSTYYPELRFDVDNGVCLCGECHMRYHCDFHRSTRVKCTEYDFMNFVKLACHFNGTWNSVMCSDELPYADAEKLLPHSCVLSNFTVYQIIARLTSPDSVVGYVTELAAERRRK